MLDWVAQLSPSRTLPERLAQDSRRGRYLWLHVAVDDAVGVQVVQRLYQLLGDVLHYDFRQLLVVLQDLEEFSCASNAT